MRMILTAVKTGEARMKTAKFFYATGLLLGLAILLAAMPLALSGCSGCQKEEPPVPTPAPEAPKAAETAPKALEPTPAPEPAPAPPAAPAIGPVEPVPVTYELLKLEPEQSVFGVALPPLTGLVDKGTALAKRFVPEGTDVDAELNKKIAEIAVELGSPDAKTLAEIGTAKGIDLAAPCAVFVDYSTFMKKAADMSKSVKDAQAAAEAAKPAEAAPAEAAPAEGTATAAEQPPTAPAAPVPPMPNPIDLIPDMAAVFTCSDPAKAEASMKDVEASITIFDMSKKEDVVADDVTIHSYDGGRLGYFINGNKAVIGTSLDMLKSVANRFKNPVQVRYGTAEWKASLPDEVVFVMRMNRLMPALMDMMSTMSTLDPTMAPQMEAQVKMMQDYVKVFSGDDPFIATLGWTEKAIEIMSRMDLSKHPDMKAFMGQTQPLRLATLLPEGTLLFLAQRFNNEMKQSIKNTWAPLAAMPELQQEAGFVQVMGIVNQVIEVIGDEFTIGVTTSGGGMPAILAVAGLANPEQAKVLIGTLAPTTPTETYSDVEISMLALPSPVPAYIAFPGDTAVVSNDLDKLKSMIDAVKNKTVSNLFASMNPPLDPAVPRQTALVLNSKLVTDVVLPLATIVGGLPPDIQEPVTKLSTALREIRILSEEKDNWYDSAITVYFN